MDVSLGKAFASSLDKVVHKIVVLIPSDSALTQAQIQFVIQQLFILYSVSVNIDSNGWQDPIHQFHSLKQPEVVVMDEYQHRAS